MNNSRQYFVKRLFRDVFGVDETQEVRSYGYRVSGTGLVFVNIVTPDHCLIQGSKTGVQRIPFEVFFDKIKSGYSIKVKLGGVGLEDCKSETILRRARTLLDAMGMLGQVDIYKGYKDYPEKKIAVLRLRTTTLPK